jgi:hypothetical protein
MKLSFRLPMRFRGLYAVRFPLFYARLLLEKSFYVRLRDPVVFAAEHMRFSLF